MFNFASRVASLFRRDVRDGFHLLDGPAYAKVEVCFHPHDPVALIYADGDAFALIPVKLKGDDEAIRIFEIDYAEA